MEKLKVLLADASVTSRKIIADAVERTSLGIVVHTAPNSSITLEWLQQCPMDVVLLGASLAGRDNPGLVEKIKSEQPDIEIIIIGDLSPGTAEITIRALEMGALDFIFKKVESDDTNEVEKIRDQLNVLFTQIKVKKYSTVNEKKAAGEKTESENRTAARKSHFGKPDMVLFASSTGGPAALESVLKKLPGDFPVPILVVQHMPAEFTAVFASNLDKICELDIVEAGNGTAVKSGQAVIAPGGWHMTVNRSGCGSAVAALDKSPYVNGVRPSADVLFSSVAREYEGRNILAVILTGMGNDGMRGVLELKAGCSCYCITQSESTSVVYGMPRCVSEAGLSDETVDIGEIAGRICRLAI